MTGPSRIPARRLVAVALLLALSTGCSMLRSTVAPPPPAFYSLDNAGSAAPAAKHPATSAPGALPPAATLIVNPPHAAAGFDSPRIIYARTAHQLEYYAHNEWIDTPARMLAPLIVAELRNSATFRAVALTPSAAVGDLRLDTEIVRLQQDLDTSPGRVRFTLRAYLIDNTTRQVLASREFDQSVATTSETPYGGVVAANRAVRAVLEQLADFCRAALAGRAAGNTGSAQLPVDSTS